MSKIKTYYHEKLIKMSQRSANYRYTLSVVDGQIQDTGHLEMLRQIIATRNADMRRNGTGARVHRSYHEQLRYVIDLKWRGPRHGRYYTTLRQHARAVDVYVRLRRDWVPTATTI